jgi:carbamate kinase
VVLALGGNALARAGEPGTITNQFRHARESVAPIVELAAEGWRIAIVHGNGPQVGDELVRNELARERAAPLPLGVLVAGTAGWIGYMLQQSLANGMRRAGVARDVVTVVTQTIVDPLDPAFARPTKPVGHPLGEAEAAVLAARGVAVGRDGKGQVRRLASSPLPRGIVEGAVVRGLVEAGVVVIAAGGGGPPVHDDPVLGWEGLDAVVDKDRTAAILAHELGAGILVFLTDVDAVYRGWGTPSQAPIRRLTADGAAELAASGALDEGGMRPKVEAAAAFVCGGGDRAIIARLSDGPAAFRGTTGTTITRDA